MAADDCGPLCEVSGDWLLEKLDRMDERQREQGQLLARIDERTENLKADARKSGGATGAVAGFFGAFLAAFLGIGGGK